MPQFDISFYFSQFFWMTVCLCVLVYSFKKIFIPKMNDILAKRDDYINKYNNQADIIENEITAVRDKIALAKQETAQRTNDIIRNAIKNADETVNNQLSAIKEENEALINGIRTRLTEEMKNIGKTSKINTDEIAHEIFDKLFKEDNHDAV